MLRLEMFESVDNVEDEFVMMLYYDGELLLLAGLQLLPDGVVSLPNGFGCVSSLQVGSSRWIAECSLSIFF
jgi:hypothetical protein